MVEIITDIDIALLVNTPAEAEFLLHSLEQTAGNICLHVNANKTECMAFKLEGFISTQSGRTQKLVEKFTYLGSNISSTESYVDIQLAKAWTAINGLSMLQKSDLSDKIKPDPPAPYVPILLYGCTT